MTQKDPPFSSAKVSEKPQDAAQQDLPALELELAPDVLPSEHSGYNPYERDTPDTLRTPAGAAPRTDLRKLSEWIKLRQQVEAHKGAPPDPTGEFRSLGTDKPKR